MLSFPISPARYWTRRSPNATRSRARSASGERTTCASEVAPRCALVPLAPFGPPGLASSRRSPGLVSIDGDPDRPRDAPGEGQAHLEGVLAGLQPPPGGVGIRRGREREPAHV